MDNNVSKCIEIADVIRNNGINTDVYLEDKKVKAKFKYADKLGIKYTVIIGEEELKQNKVTLKNMITGEQELLSLEEAISKIKE
jgi:histidyl-tRNA synthetase